MKLSEYVSGAKITESAPSEFKVNSTFFKAVIDGMIAYGELLDIIKKHVFYGKDYDTYNIIQQLIQIEDSFHLLGDMTSEESKIEQVYYGNPRIYHSIIGINTEAVELLQQLSSSYMIGIDIDPVNTLEEFGDLCWYQAIGIDALDGDWDNVLKINLKKLHKRYSGQFSKNAALNRNISKELEILENLIK